MNNPNSNYDTNFLSYDNANRQNPRFNLLPSSDDVASKALSVHMSRTLLSDYDYDEQQQQHQKSESNNNDNENKKNIQQSLNTKNFIKTALMNLSKSNNNNESIELVNINDTWHFINPNLCSKLGLFNQTHSIK